MAGLRRTLSVQHVAESSLPVCERQVDTKDQESSIWSRLAHVDCGCCMLSLQRCTGADDSELPTQAVARLVIRTKRRVTHAVRRGERLLASLEELLASRVDFVATYDLRSHHRTQAPFAEDLAKFCDDNATRWGERLKSCALLIEENLLSAAVQGSLGGFVRTVPRCCPFLVCHGPAEADAFFGQSCGAWGTSSSSAPPTLPHMFVSVASVLAEPARRGAACLASLAPALANGFGHLPAVFHTMPNGDVRVIQSCTEGTAMFGRTADSKMSDPPEDGETAGPLTGLKLECPQEEMQGLVGVHFLIAELIVDAELEALVRPTTFQIRAPIHRHALDCFAGAWALFRGFLDCSPRQTTTSTPVASDREGAEASCAR